MSTIDSDAERAAQTDNSTLESVTIDGQTIHIRQQYPQGNEPAATLRAENIITVSSQIPAEQQLHEVAKVVGYAWLRRAVAHYGDAPRILTAGESEADHAAR